VARDHEQTPTPIRPPAASQTGMTLDELQAEVARRVRAAVLVWLGRIGQWVAGLSIGAGGTYYATRSDEPQHREQPASGPEPQPEPRPQPHALECTPAEREQLLEAEQRASRDARAAVDAMHAMRDACLDQRDPTP